MHLIRRQRSAEVLEEAKHLLSDMALDSRLFRGLHSAPESTASMPSLRSSETTLTNNNIGTMANDHSSNVKVVVRVRQFIPRGRFSIGVVFKNCKQSLT